MKQELLYDKDGTLTLSKHISNLQIVPTSASIVVYDQDGDELTSGSCDISATGTMSFDVSSTYTDTLGENLRAEWEYVYSGDTHNDITYFDIVKKTLHIRITDDDLLDEYPPLARFGYNLHGEVVTGGTGTTFIDSNSFNVDDDYFRGGEVLFLSGDNQSATAKVTAYVASTGQFTIDKSLTIAVGDRFVVRKSYTSEISRAFQKILDFIRSKGQRPALVIEDQALVEANIYGALMLIFLAAGQEYEYQHKEYKEAFYTALNSIVYVYDTDEDNIADEADSSMGQVRFRR